MVLSLVSSIQENPALRSVPPNTDALAGILEFDGGEAPVYDLAELLHGSTMPSLTHDSRGQQSVVLVDCDGGTQGFLIDDVSVEEAVDERCLWPIPRIVINPAKPYFKAVVHEDPIDDGRVTSETDPDKEGKWNGVPEPSHRMSLLVDAQRVVDPKGETRCPTASRAIHRRH